ncbi:hypothetical protein OR1_04175 [Geobacter sp. OR-1]|nr:hypothetical protein OR1_04175 [Geobacter sp. OR-1]
MFDMAPGSNGVAGVGAMAGTACGLTCSGPLRDNVGAAGERFSQIAAGCYTAAVTIEVAAFVGIYIRCHNRRHGRIRGARLDRVTPVSSGILHVRPARHLAAETVKTELDRIRESRHLGGAVTDVVTGIAVQIVTGMSPVRPGIACRQCIARPRGSDHAGIAAKGYGCGRIAVAAAASSLKAGVVRMAGSTDCLGCGMIHVCRQCPAGIGIVVQGLAVANFADPAGTAVYFAVIPHTGYVFEGDVNRKLPVGKGVRGRGIVHDRNGLADIFYVFRIRLMTGGTGKFAISPACNAPATRPFG